MLELEQIKVSSIIREDELIELVSGGIGKLIGLEIKLNCLLETSLSYDMNKLIERGTTLGISDSIKVGLGLFSVHYTANHRVSTL